MIVELDASRAEEAYKLLRETYGDLEDVFLRGVEALLHGRALGVLRDGLRAFLAVRKLPGVVEAFYLAARPGDSWALEELVRRVLKEEPEVRFSAIGLPHIISVLTDLGLQPVRRILKIMWSLDKPLGQSPERQGVKVVRVTEELVDMVAEAYLEGLETHWDWWIREEAGGREEALRAFKEWMRRSRWFVALYKGKVVGAAGFTPHPDIEGVARFSGVAVRPAFRMKGIGRAIMGRILREARRAGFRRLVVYTVSPITGLAPGATLYLKTGGCVKAEYIHFYSQGINLA